MELVVEELFIVSKATASLPFQLEDASKKVEPNDEGDNGGDEEEEEKEEADTEKQQVKVGMKTRLNNRVIDLRTPAK